MQNLSKKYEVNFLNFDKYIFWWYGKTSKINIEKATIVNFSNPKR